FKKAPASIADIKITFAIEGDAGGDAHAFDVRFRSTRRIDTINIPFKPARHKQVAGKAERKAGRVHDVGHKWCDRSFRSDLVNRYRGLLTTSSAVCGVNVPVAVDRGIADRIKAGCEPLTDLVGKWTTCVSIGCNT